MTQKPIQSTQILQAYEIIKTAKFILLGLTVYLLIVIFPYSCSVHGIVLHADDVLYPAKIYTRQLALYCIIYTFRRANQSIF